MIQTVLGTIEPSQLGHCQPHEHLMVQAGPATDKHPALLLDDEALALAELSAYHAAGGGSLIDCQPGGAGRDAQALARISKASGVHIVAVTGYHLPMFYPAEHSIHTAAEEQLFRWFLGELTEGIEHTSIKAGAVKAALDAQGLCDPLKTRLRAAARAAAEAKVPLILHTEKGAGAVDAVELCESVGLAPQHLLVCHVDRQAEEYAIHEAIAATGAMLEYDTIGRWKYHDDESERRLILHMMERGYTKQLLLSLDTTRERLASYGGTPGLCYLLRDFLPSLEAMGASLQELALLTVGNPARIFIP